MMSWKKNIKKCEKYKSISDLVKIIKREFVNRSGNTYTRALGFLSKHDVTIEISYSLERIKILEDHNNVTKSRVYSFDDYREIRSIILNILQ